MQTQTTLTISCVNDDLITLRQLERDDAQLLQFLQLHDHEGASVSLEESTLIYNDEVYFQLRKRISDKH